MAQFAFMTNSLDKPVELGIDTPQDELFSDLGDTGMVILAGPPTGQPTHDASYDGSHPRHHQAHTLRLLNVDGVLESPADRRRPCFRRERAKSPGTLFTPPALAFPGRGQS